VRGLRALQSIDDGHNELQGPDLLARLDHVIDLERALAHLPGEQRAVLLLVSIEEFSYEEVAAMLDIPIGTVMSRLSRARARLRQLMDAPPVPNSAKPNLRVMK
jgi:RNA polymerase sigma-70 factor (ECF subfamily)